MTTIQEPKQERSIEKKNTILIAGYKLICEKGFYHTNTAEIAKEAGVSSGIVYRYFKDKKDIFLQGLQKQVNPLFDIIFNQLEAVKDKQELEVLLPTILEKFIAMHSFNEDQFRELTAMSLLDEDFNMYIKQMEIKTCKLIEDTLRRLQYSANNRKEKAYMIWNIANHLCDDYVSARTLDIDYSFVIKQTMNYILRLLEE